MFVNRDVSYESLDCDILSGDLPQLYLQFLVF